MYHNHKDHSHVSELSASIHEEYVKNRKPDKLSLKNLVDPSLEKPYDKDELALLSHLAVIYSESITPASEDENPEAEADDDDDDDDF